jgi:hypothetical protein
MAVRYARRDVAPSSDKSLADSPIDPPKPRQAFLSSTLNPALDHRACAVIDKQINHIVVDDGQCQNAECSVKYRLPVDKFPADEINYQRDGARASSDERMMGRSGER